MANVLRADIKQQVIHQLVEGTSIRSTERLTRLHRDTIMRLLVKVGTGCQEMLDRRMVGHRSVGAPAAIVNAIFDVTGGRVRDLPVTPDELL